LENVDTAIEEEEEEEKCVCLLCYVKLAGKKETAKNVCNVGAQVGGPITTTATTHELLVLLHTVRAAMPVHRGLNK
jgi:hypothetical protein